VRLVAADAAQGIGRVSNFKLVHTVIAKITVFFFGCLRRQAHLAIVRFLNYAPGFSWRSLRLDAPRPQFARKRVSPTHQIVAFTTEGL